MGGSRNGTENCSLLPHKWCYRDGRAESFAWGIQNLRKDLIQDSHITDVMISV